MPPLSLEEGGPTPPGSSEWLVVFRPLLRQHLSHERKEVVRIHKQIETLEVTGC
jgi:hypothetical protein